MSDANVVSHEDAVNAVRKALVDAAKRSENNPDVAYIDNTLKLAQAYELVSRSGPDQW